MKILFLTDPLIVHFGSVRPALLLSTELRRRGYEIVIISQRISGDIVNILKEQDIHVFDLGMKFIITPHIPTFEAWLRATIISLFKQKHIISNELNDDYIIVNTSSCILGLSHVYYAQGPMTSALKDMLPEMPRDKRVIVTLCLPILRKLEKEMVKTFRRYTKLFIANSRFCKSMYESLGIKVDGVIYPPIASNFFKPMTSKPEGDYILVYFGVYGKESKYRVIKRIADAGVKIKAFGSKPGYIPDFILKHPNIEFLGYVPDDELVHLYSNALFTLFTFTHEPFGYVPVESMACGTPVLTYNKQGPGETVIHGVTGWLANSDDELVKLAIRIWREGYPSQMRTNCRERAIKFDVRITADQWLSVLRMLMWQQLPPLNKLNLF
jgi:glycosyltransferase involved in cell wall biosynthesis